MSHEWEAVNVHYEDGSYWAEVVGKPGCFASGETPEELFEAIDEVVGAWSEPDCFEAPAEHCKCWLNSEEACCRCGYDGDTNGDCSGEKAPAAAGRGHIGGDEG